MRDVSLRDGAALDHPRVPRDHRRRRDARLPGVREERPVARVDQQLDDRVAALGSPGGEALRVVPGPALARLHERGRAMLRRLRLHARPALRPQPPDVPEHGGRGRRHLEHRRVKGRPRLPDLLQRRRGQRAVRGARERLADVPVGHPGVRPGRQERGPDHGDVLRRRHGLRRTTAGTSSTHAEALSDAEAIPHATAVADSGTRAQRNGRGLRGPSADARADADPHAESDAATPTATISAAGRRTGRALRAATSASARSGAHRRDGHRPGDRADRGDGGIDTRCGHSSPGRPRPSACPRGAIRPRPVRRQAGPSTDPALDDGACRGGAADRRGARAATPRLAGAAARSARPRPRPGWPARPT